MEAPGLNSLTSSTMRGRLTSAGDGGSSLCTDVAADREGGE